MARILYLHGLGGSTCSPKVLAMQSKFGQECVHAAEFPFSRESLKKLGLSVPFRNFKAIRAELTKMGAESEMIAQEAYDLHQPDILVGSSLGGALAMRLAADKHLPSVLLTPVWNTEIRDDYLSQFLVGRMPILQNIKTLMPFFGPLLLWRVHYLAGFRFSYQVQPRTIILHSPRDEIFDPKQSVKLLANSPLPEGDAETAFIRSVMDTMVQRGYETEGRLVKVGEDHQMDDPDAIKALIDAICLLSGEKTFC